MPMNRATMEELGLIDRYLDAVDRMGTLQDEQLADELSSIMADLPAWSMKRAAISEAIMRLRSQAQYVAKLDEITAPAPVTNNEGRIKKAARKVGLVAYRAGRKISFAKHPVFENK